MDLLQAFRIKFTAVIGHSSGEIICAYAAGCISAREATCIAYFWGLYSYLAEGIDGQPGGMLATDMPSNDIRTPIFPPDFANRLSIAVVNSPSRITLTGDKESIAKVQAILADKGRFARIWQINKA
jgi:hybrid polyketide synthase/nonribosomal peptide synthetase ACE1